MAFSLFWAAWGVYWGVVSAPWWLKLVDVSAAGLSLFTAGWRVFVINPRLERTFGPDK